MVLKHLLENITDLFSEKTNNNKKNKRSINQLSQGLTYLQNKQRNFKQLSDSSILLENFDTGKLDQVSRNELTVLEKLKSTYDEKLSQYSTSYKVFMEGYYTSTQGVKTCKADCASRHRPGTAAWGFSKTACNAGCDLKGPYISKCASTYKGTSINNQCADITKGKCTGSGVVLGMLSSVAETDANNISIKDGCCECGGGTGGPPTAEINSKTVYKCEDVPQALGYSAGKGGYTTNRCYQARVSSANKNKNLWQSYAKLSKDNEDLIKLAQNIFDKITQLKTLDGNINRQITDEETHLKNQLSLYENVYTNIKEYDGTKHVTIEGQVEDVLLKEKSQSLHLFIWLGLAMLTFSLVLARIKK